MASSSPYSVKWGILATGGIAETFSKDLLTNPASRDVHDVRHEIVAAASSSSKERAAEFLTKVKAPSGAKAYGSYHELVADPDVQIIYVATPHSHHFQNAMLALEAGKHVLCEKALTINASQARKLVEKARAKDLFFMEAVWTRYFPLSIKVRELAQSGAVGTIYRTIATLISHVLADLSINADKGDGKLTFPDSNRMVNLDLAGGALLDLGIYSLTWLFQTLYHLQPEAEKEAPTVVAAINKYHTGADESTSLILQFPKHKSMGIGLTSLRLGTDPDGHNSGGAAIRIQGSKGEIQVMGPAYRPLQYKVIKKDGAGAVEVVDCPIPKDPEQDWGHGMFWEADECARCLRDGKRESATMPWSESIVIMEVMEEALKQGGVTYPELITTDVFDPHSPLNGRP
ncbi:NAD(P)-binding protein [Thozetella sp. PMI_491]|nr:NAD(P)-binding protein [Thozetella sp. PMI_491]